MSRKRTAAELLAWPSQSESDGGFTLLGVAAADRGRHAPTTIEELQERLRAKARATQRRAAKRAHASSSDSAQPRARITSTAAFGSDERLPRRCAPALRAQFDAVMKACIALREASRLACVRC